jgi:hypothetical protein
MKAVLAALLLATSLVANADEPFLSYAPSFETGNKLYADCTSNTPFDEGFCLGYIAATSDVADALKKIDVCTPKGATIREVVDVVKKYLTDHPAERHYSAFDTIITSLREVFPCPKAPPAAAPTH